MNKLSFGLVSNSAMRSLFAVVPAAAVCVATAYGCSSTADRGSFNGDGGSGSNGNNTEFVDGGDPGEGGKPSELCAQTAVKAVVPVVDIIVIIDASGSMSEELIQTQQNINDFASSIGTAGLDYRVLMIAGGQGGGTPDVCVPPPLGGTSCASKPPKFYNVGVHVESNDALQILLDTYDNAGSGIYHADKPWRDMVRKESYKIFVAITDDDAYLSSPTGLSPDLEFDRQLLAKAPKGMFGDKNNRRYVFDSIVGWTPGTPQLSSQTCPTAVNTGSAYQGLSKLTKGLVDSVCNTSFAGVFDNLAKGLQKRLACQLDLPKTPDDQELDPTQVEVQYTNADGDQEKLTHVTDPTKCRKNPDGWYYDDPDKPKQVVLCSEICDTVAADTEGKIDVLIGCPGAPPK